jgi:hypothetical protein
VRLIYDTQSSETGGSCLLQDLLSGLNFVKLDPTTATPASIHAIDIFSLILDGVCYLYGMQKKAGLQYC